MPEQSFTITATALQALMGAVQAHLNNTQNALKSLSILSSAYDAQLVSAWQAFEKTLTPVVEAPAVTPADTQASA